MSACESKGMEQTLQRDETRIHECTTVSNSSDGCEFGQVYSSFPLRRINSLDLSLNMKALSPS